MKINEYLDIDIFLALKSNNNDQNSNDDEVNQNKTSYNEL